MVGLREKTRAAGRGKRPCNAYARQSLAVHKEYCASVMRRLQVASVHGLFPDQPEVWRLVLDELAADETLPTARAALLHYFQTYLADPALMTQARRYCLAVLLENTAALPGYLGQL